MTSISPLISSLHISSNTLDPTFKCTLVDREGIGHKIPLSFLKPWGNLSSAFPLQEPTPQMKFDASSKTLSNLTKFFIDWSLKDNEIEAWNKLQKSILKESVSEIIKQIAEIDTLAETYHLPKFRTFIQNIILHEQFYHLINDQTIQDLKVSIEPEQIENLPLYRVTCLGLINYFLVNHNFEQVNTLFNDIVRKIGIDTFSDWMNDILPIKLAVPYLRILLSIEDQDFDTRFDFAISLLKKYFPDCLNYLNRSPNKAFLTYMLMIIAEKTQTVEQAEKLFTSISELSPHNKQNYLKISEKEKKIFDQDGFSEITRFNSTPSILLTVVFKKIHNALLRQNKHDEIEKITELWIENIKLYEEIEDADSLFSLLEKMRNNNETPPQETNSPSMNFEEMLVHWNNKKHLDSMAEFRKLFAVPLNLNNQDLYKCVDQFCERCGIEEALKFSWVLNKDEKKVWIKSIIQSILENNKAQFIPFFKLLKDYISKDSLIKNLNQSSLEFSNVNEYIEVLNTVLKYVEKYTQSIESLSLKKFEKLAFQSLIINSFKFSSPEVFQGISKLLDMLKLKADDPLKKRMSLLENEELKLDFNSAKDVGSQLFDIEYIINININSPIQRFKNILELTANKLLEIYKRDDRSLFKHHIEVIHNRLIKKCWSFFKDSSFESEREFLKSQLQKLSGISLKEKWKKKQSYMLCLLTSDATHVASIKSSLKKLGTVIGKQNDLQLLKEIRSCRSTSSDHLVGNLTLLTGYLETQKHVSSLDYFSSLSPNFVEGLLLSLLHPLPQLPVKSTQSDEKEIVKNR